MFTRVGFRELVTRGAVPALSRSDSTRERITAREEFYEIFTWWEFKERSNRLREARRRARLLFHAIPFAPSSNSKVALNLKGRRVLLLLSRPREKPGKNVARPSPEDRPPRSNKFASNPRLRSSKTWNDSTVFAGNTRDFLPSVKLIISSIVKFSWIGYRVFEFLTVGYSKWLG